jgi:hypothetical protein
MSAERTLPASDLARLRAFQRQADWLRRSKLMQSKNIKFKLSLKFVREEGTKWEFEGYEREHFLAVLPVLRQFVLKGEPVHLFNVHNVIMRSCDRKEIRNWVSYARQEWSDALKSMPKNSILFALAQFRDVDDVVQKCFYGFGGLFHVDLESELLPMQTEEVMLAALQKVFPRLWNCIRNMDASITSWLDKPNEPVPELNFPRN